MNDRLKFAAFGGGLVVLFGAALGIGALVGDPTESASGTTSAHSEHQTEAAPGLANSEQGYALTDVTAPTVANQQGACVSGSPDRRAPSPSTTPCTSRTCI